MLRIHGLVWALAGMWAAGSLPAQYGDSLRGAAVLRERGCTECHSVLGRGGTKASALGQRLGGALSPATFAAELWNHSPEMWVEMERAGRDRPELTAQDIRDVFVFLYAMQHFEPSGDIDRGRGVFLGKECHRCHGLVRTESGGIGPAVPDWPTLKDPVRFLEAMWNHGEVMLQETRSGRMIWPTLTERELSDLLAYIYTLPNLPPRLGRIELGSTGAGMRLFDDLGCIRCHSILETDPDLVPLAANPGVTYTISGLAVAMWNHQPIMREWAEETGLEIPTLEEGQMAHLLSYLMEEGLLERIGNEKRGARLFESRGCAACHGETATPLPKREWRTTDLVAAVWSHGPEMRDRMARAGRAWPVLSGADITDLVAWLNASR